MLLRKRTRSHQKDQNMNAISESYFHSDMFTKSNPLLNVFVGFNSRSSESDSVRSPTSPLDFRIFSSLGSPFRPQKSSHNESGYHHHHQKSWDCNKVGLSIIDGDGDGDDDDDDDDGGHSKGKVTQSPDNKTILFGRQMSVRSSNFGSLPKNASVFPIAMAKPTNVVFEIGDDSFRACSLDSGGSRYKSRFPDNVETSLITATDIEMSEDYTCVRTHGPNPKVTHIYGDCILECQDHDGDDDDAVTTFLKDDFLKFCYSCNKELDGEDIYMYRGEKAFCSYTCRSKEIEIDDDSSSEISEKCDKGSLFITTTT